jgi:putative ABC transport system substrate-binding protein
MSQGMSAPGTFDADCIEQCTGPLWTAFDQRLKELGYTDGENLGVEFVDLNGPISNQSEAMRELIGRKADILIASGTEVALKSAMGATDKLPIVMIAIDYDPLALHYVASLARPGGNVTGVFFQQVELAMKRLQLMKEILPSIEAATVFWNANSVAQWEATQRAGTALGLRLAGIELKEQPYDYEAALAKAAPQYRGALVVMTSTEFFFDRGRLANMALRDRIPTIFAFREWAVYCPTALTSVQCIDSPPTMWTVSCTARNPQSCRCSNRPNLI